MCGRSLSNDGLFLKKTSHGGAEVTEAQGKRNNLNDEEVQKLQFLNFYLKKTQFCRAFGAKNCKSLFKNRAL
jgi:hypothetical protein